MLGNHKLEELANDEGKLAKDLQDEEELRKTVYKNEQINAVPTLDPVSVSNREGQKYWYNRSFLLRLQLQPMSQRKPEGLPDLSIIKDDVTTSNTRIFTGITDKTDLTGWFQLKHGKPMKRFLTSEQERKAEVKFDIMSICNQSKIESWDDRNGDYDQLRTEVKFDMTSICNQSNIESSDDRNGKYNQLGTELEPVSGRVLRELSTTKLLSEEAAFRPPSPMDPFQDDLLFSGLIWIERHYLKARFLGWFGGNEPWAPAEHRLPSSGDQWDIAIIGVTTKELRKPVVIVRNPEDGCVHVIYDATTDTCDTTSTEQKDVVQVAAQQMAAKVFRSETRGSDQIFQHHQIFRKNMKYYPSTHLLDITEQLVLGNGVSRGASVPGFYLELMWVTLVQGEKDSKLGERLPLSRD